MGTSISLNSSTLAWPVPKDNNFLILYFHTNCLFLIGLETFDKNQYPAINHIRTSLSMKMYAAGIASIGLI